MSGQIRMTPEQMRSRASEVRNQGETMQEVVNRVQNIINELQTEWEGQASRAFAEQFERLRPAFLRYAPANNRHWYTARRHSQCSRAT